MYRFREEHDSCPGMEGGKSGESWINRHKVLIKKEVNFEDLPYIAPVVCNTIIHLKFFGWVDFMLTVPILMR
jgi:hypothetical protein